METDNLILPPIRESGVSLQSPTNVVSDSPSKTRKYLVKKKIILTSEGIKRDPNNLRNRTSQITEEAAESVYNSEKINEKS